MEPENTVVVKNGKMTHQNREALEITDSISENEARERLLDYKERTGKSQAEIAKEMSISEPKLSQFLKGTYKSPGAMIPQIMQLLDIGNKKEIAPKEPGFCRTTISGAVMDSISNCHIQRKPGIVYGDAGVGKTMAIQEYQRQNPDNAIIITASPSFATVMGINELIAKELHIQEKISRRIYAEAIERLKGSNKVIIIDEAQQLSPNAIEHLRCLSDEGHVGVVFVGNENLYAKIYGDRQAKYAQLFNRMIDGEQVRADRITREDIELVFGESSLDPQVIDVLLKVSRTQHAMRGTVNLFVNTAAAFRDISVKGIAQVARKMNIR